MVYALPRETALPHRTIRPVLARHRRQRGDEVRALTGTDDNSLKNVLAAEAAGIPTRDLVDRNAFAFQALRDPLALSFDDFIRTSHDPRHRPGVERLWRACAASGDLYRRHYEGLYCVGCEQFYTPAELPEGRCPEHGTVPQQVAEENWFFRLSRYQHQLHALISDGRIRVEPAARRHEVLAFIAGGLEDFSISRSRTRARGWGIPVPDDPDQVVYVWWDALGNYVTALDGPLYDTWWRHGDRRVHLLGKGVLRFHAVYWPAMLLSAGEPLPTDILVHDYLTVDGAKISKSSGAAVDPVALVEAYGTDAVRWWLLREVPRVGDADFTVERLTARADQDLANGLGNLVNRVVTMVHRYRNGVVPPSPVDGPVPGGPDVATLVDTALEDFDFRRATAAVWRIVEDANRYIEEVRPWHLAKAGRDGDLDAALGVLLRACRALGVHLEPFLPETAARITAQCTDPLPQAQPLFPRIGTQPLRGSPR